MYPNDAFNMGQKSVGISSLNLVVQLQGYFPWAYTMILIYETLGLSLFDLQPMLVGKSSV